MCKYCEAKKDGDYSTYDMYYQESEDYKHWASVSINLDDNTLEVDSSKDGLISVDINFCPMCGRRIRPEKKYGWKKKVYRNTEMCSTNYWTWEIVYVPLTTITDGMMGKQIALYGRTKGWVHEQDEKERHCFVESLTDGTGCSWKRQKVVYERVEIK